ncbi:MAG: penicillin-binding transpeptidase domain-containing protein [Lachnospiraceae bacterium]|nr:penicillin-binding transpeptidase domain-containing protein [Lachnospiraceae bacterium]
MLKNLLSNILYQLKGVLTSRLFVVGVVAAMMFGTLVMRLFTLQIVEGESYQEEYQQTSTKTVEESYTRGTIYDRNGKKLAYNKLAYSVGIVDNGSYNAYERNLMIVRLIEILDKHGETYSPALSIACEDGEYVFTAASERALIRFLKDVDVYSDKEGASEEKSHPVDWYTPDYVVEKLAERYGVGITIENGRKEQTYELDKETLLKLVDIRYALALNSYRKYVPAIIASDISEEAVSDIMEHEYDLLGVSIEQDSIRTYADAEYFAPIIGYTGQVSSEDLDSLDDSYAAGDIIGKTGIEASYEDVLKGTKGSKKLVVDNQGIVLSVESETEAQAGNDVYLTIDRDLQVAAYNLLEQHLAGILESKIVNGDVTITSGMASSDIMIPIKDVYFQLINNNVLSIDAFADTDASDTEKRMNQKHETKLNEMLDSICSILLDENSMVNDSYSEEEADSLNYVFSLLQDEEILKKNSIDKSSDLYRQWTADEISLRSFLLSALTQGWIDVTKLNLDSRYADTEETMNALVDTLRGLLSEDEEYNKKIYRYLIDSNSISGNELCLALFDQGVLKYSEEDYNRLLNGGSAYYFIKEKISNIEITPAQLALDPCSGSVVLTDTDTGEVLALVTYPSYDNNRATSDSSYFAQLNVDLSKPLYNRATQTRTAPGSIFKPLTALAGMKEGVLGVDEKITTASNGTFTGAGYELRCSIAPSNHGTLGIATALEKSCNYFFSEVAYRLSLDSNGKYSETKGVAEIAKYAEMFGLGENSGIEISEISPQVTKSDAVPSGIGQGTHNYTNTQINRYLTALATKGDVLDLNLVKKTTDPQGSTLSESEKEVIRKLDFTEAEWNVVHEGMHNAIYANSKYSSWFSKLDVQVAGKTGTAQEDKKRGNHANFICFAPYDSPEVAISVSIPYGYTAANSVSVASDVLAYYYGKLDLKTILKGSAASASGAVDPAD